jgi:hypothetical protein
MQPAMHIVATEGFEKMSRSVLVVVPFFLDSIGAHSQRQMNTFDQLPLLVVKHVEPFTHHFGLTWGMDRIERVAKHMVGSAASSGPAKEGRPPITSHVLDTVTGRPAVGVKVSLDKLEGNEWRQVRVVSTSSQ